MLEILGIYLTCYLSTSHFLITNIPKHEVGCHP